MHHSTLVAAARLVLIKLSKHINMKKMTFFRVIFLLFAICTSMDMTNYYL